MIQKSFLIAFFLIGLCDLGWSQTENPFESEIVMFEREDSIYGYKSDFILFTGSSSIRLWKNLEEDMKGLNVLNRGFGGAKLTDLNDYWDRILAQHKPKMVVLYCGENDIWDGYAVDDAFRHFKNFQKRYRARLKGVPLIYIAMKPSPNRWEKWSDFQKTDKKIKRAIRLKSKQKFVDMSVTMLLEDGTPRPDIFISDELHMNQKGYEGWKEVLRPIIEKKLVQ